MDFLWIVLQPLTMILLYFTVFSTIFASKMGAAEGGTAMFALYLCSGFLAWSAAIECITSGANAFINNATYLKKLSIPEQVFVAKESAVATYGLVISFVLLIIISMVFFHFPSWTWLLLPLPLLLFQCFAFGLGMFLGIMNVFFKDVGHSLPILFQAWFWLTPIVYPITILPEFMQDMAFINPAFHYITAVREIFLYHRFPDSSLWIAMISWSLIVPLLAYLVLRRLRPEIRDCI
ncbi:MAG: ABC transporter permease [Nitrospina sp.]|jgi:lipopolysaccharide transport system permease protein|nr:ABC transporter permease [Nitrospina sp.]